MVEPSAPIPNATFSPGTQRWIYILVVALAAVGNGLLFTVLTKEHLAPSVGFAARLALSAFFGIFFAGACNMSAASLGKILNRQSLSDRIIIFMLSDIAGCTFQTGLVHFFVKGLDEMP